MGKVHCIRQNNIVLYDYIRECWNGNGLKKLMKNDTISQLFMNQFLEITIHKCVHELIVYENIIVRGALIWNGI